MMPSRKLEGMETSISTVSGKPLAPAWMEVGGVQVLVDLTGGQKTGMYLDQLDQHARVAQLAKGRRVLDAFCNQGGFGLACAKAGATSVLGLDQSEDAISAARSAAARNGLKAGFEVANVFDWFTEHREATFDLIVLDPPPFARNKDSIDGALRGYKELNLRALRMLGPGVSSPPTPVRTGFPKRCTSRSSRPPRRTLGARRWSWSVPPSRRTTPSSSTSRKAATSRAS